MHDQSPTRPSHRLALLGILLTLLTGATLGSDILKERRWATQIEDALLVGEPIYLQAGGREFLAIFTPSTVRQTRGGVILLHGIGAHPDWPDVIAPLRQELPEAGWVTLSLQLPILPNDAEPREYLPLFPEADTRISAGIRYLQQQGVRTITVVSHSLGAAMGARFLANKEPGSETVRAFVGIGMNRSPGTSAHTPDALAKLTLPVLDLYGAQDLEGVRVSAPARVLAARRAGNDHYRQTEIPGADHFFRDQEALLVKQVSSWLARVTATPDR